MDHIHKERLKWIIALINQLDDDMTCDNDDHDVIQDVRKCSKILRVALNDDVDGL